jgi:Tol biopolymer transport system component/DNA-binding SARP family transcriptional activator
VLTLKAFGALEFSDDACRAVREIQTRPQRSALLAYLVLAHHGRYCRRDTLLSLFWPDFDSEHGRHALSQALTFIRRHVGPGVLITRGMEEIGVDPAAVRSDVQTFRDAVARKDWGAALASYGGDLLEGLHVEGAAPFVDWVDRERERLRESAADAAWRHAHDLIAASYLVEAERAGQVALRLVPTDESAVRTFIEALATGGDRAAALRFYERFTAVLAQELDVEPARETRAVAERIRNGEVTVNLRTPPPGVITPLSSPLAAEAKGSARAPAEASAEAGGVAPAGPTWARSPRRKWFVVGGASVALVAILALAWVAPRSDPMGLTVSDVRPITVEPGIDFLPAFSPDGRDVAFASGGQIVVRSFGHVPGQGEIRLGDPPPSTALAPSWTPDGSLVRFISCSGGGSCRWVVAPRTGGAMTPLELPAGVTTGAPELAWSPDGSRVALFRGDTLSVASARDGIRALFAMDAQHRRFGNLHSLAWSPDGRRIAFVNGSRRWYFIGWETDPASIWVMDLDDGGAREVVRGPATNWSPTWLDERRLLFTSNRDGPRGIYLVEMGRSGARGEPRLVLGGVDSHTLSYDPAAGRLAFARYRVDLTIRTYPLDRAGVLSIRDGESLDLENLYAQEQDVSADGAWLAFDAMFRGDTDLYKQNLLTGEVVRLTDSPEDQYGPRWSPDGREIAFTGMPSAGGPGQFEVFVMPAEGGTPIQVSRSTVAGGVHAWPTWSPDGLSIAFAANAFVNRGIRGEAWLVSRDSVGGPWGKPTRLFGEPHFFGVWAPDGRSILFKPRTIEVGSELLTISLAGDTLWRRDIPSTTPLQSFGLNMQIKLSPDGHTLYSRGVDKDGAEGIWAIPDFGRGEPRLVVAFDDPVFRCFYLSVGPERLYLTASRDESDIWVATLRR